MGVSEARFLQTLFGVVLAADSGYEDVGVVTQSSDDLVDCAVETLTVDSGPPLADLARRWTPCPGWSARTSIRHAPAAGAALDSLELPAFQVVTSDHVPAAGTISDERAFPICCTAFLLEAHVELRFEASRDLLDETVLASLAGQSVAVAAVIMGQPEASVGEAVEAMRSLRYEITVVAKSGFGPLSAVLEAWGQQIGLPVLVRHVQLGETQVPDRRNGRARPQRWGANLLMVDADRSLAVTPVPQANDLLEQYRRRLPAGVLPDGSPIVECNSNETRQLFDEIFRRRRYLRHGVRINDGAVVVDSGANIGMFTLFAHSQARRVRVHAFEPIPALADILEANLQLYGVDAVVSRAALGSSPAERSMVFYPRSSLQSSLYADQAADESVVRSYARQQAAAMPLLSGDGTRRDVSNAVETLLRGRFSCEQHLVPVLPLSSWIRAQEMDRIDLLKIDVERAELEVLDGIAAEHWPIIRQLVLEVHDIDHRVARIQCLLEERGFTVAVEQDALFDGSEIFMLYARKPSEELTGAHDRDTVAQQVAYATRWAGLSSVPVYVASAPGADGDNCVAAGLLREMAGRAHEITHIDLTDAVDNVRSRQPESAASETEAEVWAAAGTRLMRRITAPERPITKAIVVDADNTLWGGVCGEVGPGNVDTAGEYRAIQEFLSRQRAAGRALCLCSKNNQADVEAVFRRHPDMPLQLSDFTAVRVTWEPKSRSVAALAGQLGYSPGSLVFIDDSAAERAEVALAHPDMTVVDLPDDPRERVSCLRATWQLDVHERTAEDDVRDRFAADDGHRHLLAAAASTAGEYLTQLELDIAITISSDADADRISQLARRTTQFNLRLRPHTPASVRQLLAETTVTLSVRVRDRFGEYGLVGFVAAHRSGDLLKVQDFFLSCRALGRNVEWFMLRTLGERAFAEGITNIRLTARHGDRNAPALGFLAAVHRRYGLGASSAVLTAVVPAEKIAALDWRTANDVEAPLPAGNAAPQLPATGTGCRWPAPAPSAEDVQAMCRSTVHSRDRLAVPYMPARPGAESIIADVWQAVLLADQIGIHDNLFALGGDSLAAMAICSQLRIVHGIDVSVDVVLDHPTISGIAEHLARDRPSAALADIGDTAGELHEASHGQRRIWAAEMIGGRGNAQVIPLAYHIRGTVDTGRLETAICSAVDRHPSLRTNLIVQGGALVQAATLVPFRLSTANLAELPEADCAPAAEALAADFYAERFNMGSDLMLRALLIQLSEIEAQLLLIIHHSAADGWSVGVLNRDISAFYSNDEPAGVPESATFADYARRSLARKRRGDFAVGSAAVKSMLQPYRTRRLITDAPAASGDRRVSPRHARFPLSHTVVTRTHKLAQDLSATPFTVFLAAFQLLAGIASDSNMVVVGCPAANRADPRFEDAIGFFANLVPIPARFSWDASIGSYLRSSAATALESLRYAEVPYGLLASELAADLPPSAGSPFETLFTLQPPPSHPLTLAGCSVSRADPVVWPLPFPLMLDVEEHGEGGSALLRYDAAGPMPLPPEWFTAAYPLALKAFWALPHRSLQFLRELLRPAGTGESLQHAQRMRQLRLRALRQEGDDGDSRP
jgi:FkbH-like protein/FkbM family methyltransferase